MNNNPVTEKYAIYTVGADGKDSLAVVVDSQEEARKELEKLKSGNSCIKIHKSKVENFGQEGERVIESLEVDCWKAGENGGADKISSFQKQPDTPASSSAPQMNARGEASSSAPIAAVKDTSLKGKLNSFYEYYSHSGDIMGLGYFLDPKINGDALEAEPIQPPSPEAASAAPPATSGQSTPPSPEAASAAPPATSGQSAAPSSDLTPSVELKKTEEESIKKLTEEVSQINNKLDILMKHEKAELKEEGANVSKS